MSLFLGIAISCWCPNLLTLFLSNLHSLSNQLLFGKHFCSSFLFRRCFLNKPFAAVSFRVIICVLRYCWVFHTNHRLSFLLYPSILSYAARPGIRFVSLDTIYICIVVCDLLHLYPVVLISDL